MQMAGCIHFKLNRTAVTGAFMGFEFGHGLYPAIYSALYSFWLIISIVLQKRGICFGQGVRLATNIKTENSGFSAARMTAIQIAKGTDFHKARLAHHARRCRIFFMAI